MGDVPEKEIWISFVGILDLTISRNLSHLIINAAKDNVSRVHLQIQSPGGLINDGIFLFNFFSSLNIDVFAYNCGHIGSASATAYLGAKRRFVSDNGTFLFHRAKPLPSNTGTAPVLQSVVAALAIDDARTEAAIRSKANLLPQQWLIFNQSDLTIDAATSISVGVAHEIGYFIPKGPLFVV